MNPRTTLDPICTRRGGTERTIRFSLAAWLCLGLLVGLQCGCSSDTGTRGGASATSGAVTAANATITTDPNAPLTVFEQRRLLNRVSSNPQQQIRRLTPRERRGLAAMIQATSDDDEN